MSTWASYPYCFDTPQAVQTQMMQPPYSLSSSDFNYLYVCISVPNIFLSFVGAVLTTKIGPVRAICIYVLMLLVGQGTIAFSLYMQQGGWYAFTLIGRMLIGVSGCCLMGANLSLIPRYTAEKYISMFVGLGTMLPWTTQSLTAVLSPIIYSVSGQVYLPFLIGYLSAYGGGSSFCIRRWLLGCWSTWTEISAEESQE